MTNAARDTFVVGLRNAHAMEVQARELMERQSERLDEYPEVKSRLTAHLHETNEQLKRLERCLEACGESTSTLKDTTQSVMANMQAMVHAAAGDEILKNTFANNAFENFEIAAYKSLITVAEAAGHSNHVPALRQNLQEEEKTAQAIYDQIEAITEKYLTREAKDLKADR